MFSVVNANVAYPGIWTGLQPNGVTTGTEQILVGTAEYHFAVVETDTSFYPTIRADDGTINYASRGKDGRYLPTNVVVGQSNPDTNPFLKRAIQENRHVVHAKCMEQDFCRWREREKIESHSRRSTLQGSGRILNLVIPFQFQDHANLQRKLTSVSDLDQLLFNGPNLSVKHYFLQQSYGQLEIISEVAPWVTIPMTEAQCADKQSGLALSLHTCLQAALDASASSFSDWQTVLDSAATVTFVHSGYAAEYGGNDSDNQWFQDRIWSHAWEVETTHYQGRYAIISDKYDRKNGHMNRVGAAVHELAQVMGAPPMYGDYPGFGLGYYDVLANPWGFDGTLSHCGSMSSYTKDLFGWVELEEITEGGTYELRQSFDSNKVYIIKRGFPEGEYLLIENRQEQGYDMGMSQAGLAIYHIDIQANNVGGHPDQRDYPRDHYVVALVQADGRFDLERMEDEGDSGDLFHAGEFTGISQEGAFKRDGSLAEGGFPNTNSYQGGKEVRTGISIRNISPSSAVMSFEVSFD